MKTLAINFLPLPRLLFQGEVIEIPPKTQQSFPAVRRQMESLVILSSGIPRSKSLSAESSNRKANMGAFWGQRVTPGCLYDLTLRGTNNDQLTIFSPSKQQGRISYIKIGNDQKSVITYVSPALSGGLTKTHTYSIEEGEYGISVTSKLFNGTTEKISGPINDSWTRFRESGKFGEVEWADSVDPSHKCGYAYVWS